MTFHVDLGTTLTGFAAIITAISAILVRKKRGE